MTKKTSILLILLTSIFGVFAVGFHSASEVLPGQFSIGDYSFNGNIGIGTSSPVTTLDINGSIHIGSYNNSHFLSISPYSSSDNISYISARQERNSNIGTTKIGFQVFDDGVSRLPMVIDNEGQIGIGTASPSARLDLKSPARDNAFILLRSSTSQIIGVFTEDYLGHGVLDIRDNVSTNKVRLFSHGPSYFNGGNVGIGTTNPSSKLDIVQDADSSSEGLWIRDTSASYAGKLWMDGTTFKIQSRNADNQLILQDDGKIGMGTDVFTEGWHLKLEKSRSSGFIAGFRNLDTGTSSDVLVLQVETTTPASGNQFIAFRNGNDATHGSISGNGAGGINYATTSDRRLKENFRNLSSSEINNIIEELNPIEFNMIGYNQKQIGLIAQDVELVLPEIVNAPLNNESYYTMDYSKLTPINLMAIKELKKDKEKLEIEVETLKQRLELIEEKLK